jgi:hypothetical protein
VPDVASAGTAVVGDTGVDDAEGGDDCGDGRAIVVIRWVASFTLRFAQPCWRELGNKRAITSKNSAHTRRRDRKSKNTVDGERHSRYHI